jgi:hypothetical protein
MEKELEQIFKGYQRVLEAGPPEVLEGQSKQWLKYLSEKSVSDLPVSWDSVETPRGVSYGGNVKFSDLMIAAKNVYDSGGKGELFVEHVSSQLQDYAIGLHESQKLINQDQAAELVSLFQDKNSVRYFLDNYDFPDKSKSLDGVEENIPKIKPTYGPEVMVIRGGDGPQFDGKGGSSGLGNLRSVFTENLILGFSRSRELLQNATQIHRSPSPTGKSLAGAFQEDPELRNIINPGGYEKTWEVFVNFYNKETSNGTRDMPPDKLEALNKSFDDLLLSVQSRCAERITNLTQEIIPPNKNGTDSRFNGRSGRSGALVFEMGM